MIVGKQTMINSDTAVITVEVNRRDQGTTRTAERSDAEDYGLFGKHYLVSAENGVTRQYTLASIMEKGKYARMVRALKEGDKTVLEGEEESNDQ